ncbi:acetylornithine transaminase [Streptomonospora halophila]|uniref:Acetylornithine aminotransferase n=1 Tax=Streptomonospora halophila TaxID=427369 RepID=A0ABP9GNS7_9ACTN
MSATTDLQARFDAVLMPNYGTPPVAIARGEGCRVYDADGKAYLDLIAGIAVSALGHGHPALVAAVADQAAAVAHTSNLFLHEREVELAERLVGLLGSEGDGDVRVFFANSGTEANEAALKLVKRAADEGRPRIVAADNGFHGRTLGALSLTGKAAIRDPFGPYGTDVVFVPYGDADALRKAVDATCAAVFVEPVQGEAGVVPAPEGYLAEVRRACDEAGAAFVLDEIQSGIGRTGRWFAHQAHGVTPDVLTLAKGLGGGLPIGACVGFGRYATAFAKGDHGSTFGGNPVACAAALAVLDTVENENLLASAAELGTLLEREAAAIDHPLLAGVRGSGLWRALVLSAPASAAVQASAAAHGFLVNALTPDAVRIAPPLTISRDEVLEFTAALPAILEEAR